MVFCLKLATHSKKCSTFSGLRTIGKVCGFLGIGKTASMRQTRENQIMTQSA
jgi:hypothetical protein